MKKHVSIEDDISFMSFGWKGVLQSRVLVGFIGVRWVKSFEVWKSYALSWEESESEWKF